MKKPFHAICNLTFKDIYDIFRVTLCWKFPALKGFVTADVTVRTAGPQSVSTQRAI